LFKLNQQEAAAASVVSESRESKLEKFGPPPLFPKFPQLVCTVGREKQSKSVLDICHAAAAAAWET